MAILIWVAFGIVCGSAARLLMPGPRAGGISVGVIVGTAGSLMGGLAGVLVTDGFSAGVDLRSHLAAISGSLFAILAYRSYALRFPDQPSGSEVVVERMNLDLAHPGLPALPERAIKGT